ncbi:hypothetical protein [Lysobacter xanthus]
MAESPVSTEVVRVAPGDDLLLHAARAAVTASIHEALAAGHRRLLVDFSRWRGQERPSLALRIDSTFEWAAAAASAPGFRMALVMPPQLVDPGRIGFIVGRRAGFDFDVFGDVDAAAAWLQEPASEPSGDLRAPSRERTGPAPVERRPGSA